MGGEIEQARRRVTILGSTGSIGQSTLDVIRLHPDRFEIFALSAATRVDLMLRQCIDFRPVYAVMGSAVAARELTSRLKVNGLKTKVLHAHDALEMIAEHERTEIVMAAIVGAAGLAACLAAARAGKRLLLANKEALVVGGAYFMEAVRSGGAQLLPIDSEHSAIFQSLPADATTWERRLEKIILTASGGPFRQRDPATLHAVTPEQACAHPNWTMGRKISVDSATMMNKALEVIEARFLFGVRPEQIEVVLHPQSVIHSMVQYRDHSVIAQLGTPDMKGPIAYGLSWPERMHCGAAALDFRSLGALSFESFDGHDHARRFPCLQLAWQALRAEPGTPAVLNAANEVAVAAFLEGDIRFDQIFGVNQETLGSTPVATVHGLDDLLALDAQARTTARDVVRRWAR